MYFWPSCRILHVRIVKRNRHANKCAHSFSVTLQSYLDLHVHCFDSFMSNVLHADRTTCMCIWTAAEPRTRLSARKTGLSAPPPLPPCPPLPVIYYWPSKAVLLLLFILIVNVRSLSAGLWLVIIALWPSVGERAVPLAFHLCCFNFSPALVVCELYVSLSQLVFGAGCGVRLYRFLIIAFLSTYTKCGWMHDQRNKMSKLLIGPRQANLLLIAYASSEGSGEPAHPRSLARTFAARSYKQWVKRNLQTESQIPGPSEWLGMRSWNLSWRNARRHKFAWRGSI